jgi:hypothetical protein
MDVAFIQQIKRALRELDTLSQLYFSLSEALRQAEERIKALEAEKHGNRHRRPTRGD